MQRIPEGVSLRIFTIVPKFFGKAVHIWLGLVLLLLLTTQFTTGLSMARNPATISALHGFHTFVGYVLFGVGLVHAYYGIGLRFLGFKYAKKKDVKE